MMKLALSLNVALALLAGTCLGQDTTARTDGRPYTLTECIDIAVKNNITVKSDFFLMEGDKATYINSIGRMLPYVSSTLANQLYSGKSVNPYTYSYVTQNQSTANYSVNASVTLWNGFSLLHFLRQNREAWEAGEQDVQQAKDNIALKVIVDYLAVLSATEQLQAALAQDSAIREQVRVYEAKNAEGAIAPGDYYTLRGQLGQTDISVVNARNLLVSNKLTLTQDMNLSFTPGLTVEPITDTSVLAPYASTVDQLYSYSVAHIPAIKSVDLKEESAKNYVKAEIGNQMPTLALYGGAQTNYSNLATTEEYVNTTQINTGQYVTVSANQYDVYAPEANYISKNITFGNQVKNNVNYYVGLQLSIPILNGFNYRTYIRNARIAEETARFNQTTARITLRQNIEQYYVNMLQAFDSYKAYREQQDDYGRAYTAALAKLNEGAISSYDFVLSQSAFAAAQLNQIAAKYNYILNTRILDYYQGRLVY